MAINTFSETIQLGYEIHEWRHASAILASDFPHELADICSVLERFHLCKTFLTTPGGRKSKVSELIDSQLYEKGWLEKKFDTAFVVDGNSLASPTHSVDCYKNRVALEIEWNNKDPFFDRDLNNFRLLFELRVISVGVIVTRCDALQNIFDELGRGSSFGSSTTHMSKLLPKIEGGGGGGCPILVFGIKETLYDENC
ncbi:MAG: restriction endonuclease [Chlorobium sp.]|nr:MAG: restriction endonuclease [Chlorobium sp.]